MKNKIKYGRGSPVARVLSDRLWRQRVVKSKKIYNRKKTKPLNGASFIVINRHHVSSYPVYTVCFDDG